MLIVPHPTQRTTHCAERSHHHHHPVILLMASPLTYMNNHTERAILPIGYRTKTQYTVRLFGATPLQRHRNNAWKHLSWSSKDACYKPGFAFHACERGVESSFQSVTVWLLLYDCFSANCRASIWTLFGSFFPNSKVVWLLIRPWMTL